jgi:XRE family transcriptional regulator, aerobic/anaerobic benzoate catabolism transcriptional regulator
MGFTLRELADRSKASERFLSAMENGHANVSVVRLDEVAHAVGTSAAELLGAPALSTQASRPRVIVSLVGLRGAGKSTIGARAADRLDVPFVELDQRIAARAGMSAGEIFDLHGATYYRKLERAELQRIVDSTESAIVATAGSLVTDHVTYDLLLEKTTVVWLKSSARDHHDRVLAQGDLRPMRDRKDAMKELAAILRARRALYERASFTIDTSKLGLDRSVVGLSKIVRDEWRLARADA